MFKVIPGAFVAAIAMFLLGFIFFATPLSNIHLGGLGDSEAAAVQTALAANMPADGAGTYAIPEPSVSASQSELYARGPIAMVHYNPNGFAIGDTGALVSGFVHMLVVALLLGAALYSLAGHVRDFGARLSITILFALSVSVFTLLGDPIWYHQDWTHHVYRFVANTIMYVVAGAIIARWFLPKDVDSDDRFGEE